MVYTTSQYFINTYQKIQTRVIILFDFMEIKKISLSFQLLHFKNIKFRCQRSLFFLLSLACKNKLIQVGYSLFSFSNLQVFIVIDNIRFISPRGALQIFGKKTLIKNTKISSNAHIEISMQQIIMYFLGHFNRNMLGFVAIQCYNTCDLIQSYKST